MTTTPAPKEPPQITLFTTVGVLGDYGAVLQVTGLKDQQQADAVMAHLQRLFCGTEIEVH